MFVRSPQPPNRSMHLAYSLYVLCVSVCLYVFVCISVVS